MLRPSPEFQKRLDLQARTSIEGRALTIEQRRLKGRNRLNGLIAATALLGVGVGQYASDVRANQEIQAEASINIQIASPALDPANNHKALIFFNGLGTDNAEAITKFTGHSLQPILDGQRWSIGYNNAPLEKTVFAKKLIEAAHEQNADTFIFVGRSAGGNIIMQAQEEVRKYSSITIEAIVLDSTPVDIEALRPARQEEIAIAHTIARIPGAEYSSAVRSIGEMASRIDSYNFGTPWQRIENFATTYTHVNESIDNNKLPGMWLMFGQLLAIQDTDFESRMENIAKLPKSVVRPTMLYLHTAEPGVDPVVDTEKSSKAIAAFAHKYGIPFLDYGINGAVHTHPEIAVDAYAQTLTKAKVTILSTIAAEAARASSHRITSRFYPAPPKN